MKAQLIDISFSKNGKQRISLELQNDFLDEYEALSVAPVEVSIKKFREKRSLNANAYFHVLVNEIAKAQNLSDLEVKKKLVVDYGSLARDENGNITGAMLPANADIEQFYPYTRCYKDEHINGKHYKCYLFYKRSRDLDSKEMSRLIDGTCREAKELGIETLPPEQLSLLFNN